MPAGSRQNPQQSTPQFVEPASDPDDADIETAVAEDQMDDVDAEDDEGDYGDDLDEAADGSPPPLGPPPLPPHLKDISNLASWTVSTAKPGCSVPQLRAPSTSLFWQSDGPQPHHLNIHFFKMVSIAGIRVYLDFDMDESYTPTKIAFLAGTGYNDLQEWCVMQFENPKGWVDVDFSGVGVEGEEEEEGEPLDVDDPRKNWPVLRAMLVQVQIRENHQNGKDTHLRGLQIFARDRGVANAAMLNAGARLERLGMKTGRIVGDKKPKTRLPAPIWDEIPTLR